MRWPRPPRVSHRLFAVIGLAIASQGCGTVRNESLSPSTTLEPSFGVTSRLKVRSAPPGAEVWIGPGSADAGGSASDDAQRRLGRTPLTVTLTAEDLSPGGDLEYSIRYGASRRAGRVPHADRLIRQGGTIRIRVDLRAAPPGAPSSTE